MKLHIGSGSVYLTDWLNIDVPSPKTFLASLRPDLVEKWRTDEADYYRRHQDKDINLLRKGPLDQEYICDEYGDFEALPTGLFDEVLARQSFEHLSIREARRALAALHWHIKGGGLLRLDVPDSDETLELYRQTGDPFYKRHFLGPRRSDNGFHLPYTRERLKSLVEEYGFRFLHEEENIHWFPAFTLRFEKT